MKAFVKQHFPEKVLNALRWILRIRPLWLMSRRERWIREEYWQFGQDQRRFLFMSIARFLHINRPISGYYFEFGCNEANTMRMAWDHFRYLFDLTYVGFDSFEGLPQITPIDRQEVWEKGKLAYSEQLFLKRLIEHGFPSTKIRTVKGFYDSSLTPALRDKLLPKKAAVIYVDCDLYASTVPVLDWIVDFLQPGTVIVFDDWYCFHGDP
ncbi:MAG: class I SAM-dependent methyltransferase, partial [Betaproteobacteria bacterium]|nr:class I SAM-dependent methyltransferase [Betaproteobacteria bacterium]